MEPWQFMLLAERLVARFRDVQPHPQGAGASSAELRTSISRCYYSTFLTARDFLNRLGFHVTATGACHSVVHRALIESNERSLARAASEYATLGEYRRKADYDLSDTDVEQIEFAEDMLRLCKSAYNRITMLLVRVRGDEGIRTSLVDTIEAWRIREGEKHIWK
jgi:uncharacterized protein (UPF0332 family)